MAADLSGCAQISVLSSLKHKNIMTFYDSWLDPKTQQLNFITELFTSGTLRQCALAPCWPVLSALWLLLLLWPEGCMLTG